MNVFTYTVPPNIVDARLYALTRRMLPELPEYAIREAFAKRDVKMNGIRVGKDALVLPDAEVCLYTRHEGGIEQIPILYQDNQVVVVRKPVGISCEADAKGGVTLVDLVGKALRAVDPASPLPLLCHRLDNQTDGLLLLAKEEEAHKALLEGFKQRQIHKTYTCLVKGTPSPAQATLEAYLIKDAAMGRVRVLQNPQKGALSIMTEYLVLESGAISRLEVKLHTGRTHQIRAQMAAIGHPLLGDDVYGDRPLNKALKAGRLMLCATGLSFSLTGAMAYLNQQQFTIEPEF